MHAWTHLFKNRSANWSATKSHYEKFPVEILGRDTKQLRNVEISIVKILWRSDPIEEAT